MCFISRSGPTQRYLLLYKEAEHQGPCIPQNIRAGIRDEIPLELGGRINPEEHLQDTQRKPA